MKKPIIAKTKEAHCRICGASFSYFVKRGRPPVYCSKHVGGKKDFADVEEEVRNYVDTVLGVGTYLRKDGTSWAVKTAKRWIERVIADATRLGHTDVLDFYGRAEAYLLSRYGDQLQ